VCNRDLLIAALRRVSDFFEFATSPGSR